MPDNEEKFVRALLRNTHHVDESKLRQLYASISDRELIDRIIDTYSKSPPTFVASPNVAGYAHSVSAVLDFKGFLFLSIDLVALGIGKTYSASGPGLIFGIGVSAGTLYYDNIGDLSGPSDFNCNLLAAYVNCNFIRNGSVYASFSGVSVPFAGVSGGHGQWR